MQHFKYFVEDNSQLLPHQTFGEFYKNWLICGQVWVFAATILNQADSESSKCASFTKFQWKNGPAVHEIPKKCI